MSQLDNNTTNAKSVYKINLSESARIRLFGKATSMKIISQSDRVSLLKSRLDKLKTDRQKLQELLEKARLSAGNTTVKDTEVE